MVRFCLGTSSTCTKKNKNKKLGKKRKRKKEKKKTQFLVNFSKFLQLN